MIKLLPTAVPNIQAALTAIRSASQLLSGAPVKQYHRAVVGALAHLETTLDYLETPSNGFGASEIGRAHV